MLRHVISLWSVAVVFHSYRYNKLTLPKNSTGLWSLSGEWLPTTIPAALCFDPEAWVVECCVLLYLFVYVDWVERFVIVFELPIWWASIPLRLRPRKVEWPTPAGSWLFWFCCWVKGWLLGGGEVGWIVPVASQAIDEYVEPHIF